MVDRSRYGSQFRPDLKLYKPNPFWTAEENQRYKSLGNLERFGKWRPPGPFIGSIYLYECKPDQGFQYVNRPLPKDPWLRNEEWRWTNTANQRYDVNMQTGFFRPPKGYWPGLKQGAIAGLLCYGVCRAYMYLNGDSPPSH